MKNHFRIFAIVFPVILILFVSSLAYPNMQVNIRPGVYGGVVSTKITGPSSRDWGAPKDGDPCWMVILDPSQSRMGSWNMKLFLNHADEYLAFSQKENIPAVNGQTAYLFEKRLAFFSLSPVVTKVGFLGRTPVFPLTRLPWDASGAIVRTSADGRNMSLGRLAGMMGDRNSLKSWEVQVTDIDLRVGTGSEMIPTAYLIDQVMEIRSGNFISSSDRLQCVNLREVLGSSKYEIQVHQLWSPSGFAAGIFTK